MRNFVIKVLSDEDRGQDDEGAPTVKSNIIPLTYCMFVVAAPDFEKSPPTVAHCHIGRCRYAHVNVFYDAK